MDKFENIKAILLNLANKLNSSIANIDCIRSELVMIKKERDVYFFASCTNHQGVVKDVELNFGLNEVALVNQLYDLNLEEPRVHINWNKAILTLLHDRTIGMGYYRDKELIK